MVPLAGDEITEHIAETYLLDFNTAEAVKLMLTQKSTISFKDIIGNSYHLPAQEILTSIEPAVNKVAVEITSTIKSIITALRAVFLIGGGSQTPF